MPEQRPSRRDVRFPLSAEQYELLLALEWAGSLAEVAKLLRRDASVVSRSLKTLSEAAPVIEKIAGRWQVTQLGRQVNRLSETFVRAQLRLFVEARSSVVATLPAISTESALIVLGAQRGFHDPQWGPRNNLDAEGAMRRLVNAWRERGGRIIFCRHVSSKKGSPLRMGTVGCDFLEDLKPSRGELVIQKKENSAFSNTELDAHLRREKVDTIVLVGFTTNHCVDATARSGHGKGLTVFVVSDATATFDSVGPDGTTHSASDLHDATLTSLHEEYAVIFDSETLLGAFRA